MPAEGCIGLDASLSGVVAAVVILTHKRVDYLKQCLQSVMEVHGRQPGNRCTRWHADTAPTATAVTGPIATAVNGTYRQSCRGTYCQCCNWHLLPMLRPHLLRMLSLHLLPALPLQAYLAFTPM